MDPGFTEFQVIIGVSVILGLAFLALVFEHMRSKEASLREFNIELQVRQEERERNKPFEAVEWLQHLLGAKQATLRVSRKGAEPAKRREAADAPPGAVSAKGFRVDPASAPSAGAPAPQTDHSVPGQVLPGQTAQSSRFAPPIERRSWQKESAAGDKPVEHAPVEKTATERPGTQRQGLEKPGVEAAEPVLAARSRSPFDLAKPIQSKPIDVPSIASVTRANGFETNPVPNTPMAERDPQVAANGLPPVTDSPVTDLVAVDSEVRARSHSRLTERLQHPDEQRTRAASSLLSTLPMPAWLRKEQEEKAAARSRREPLQAADAQIFESKPQVVALAPESVTSEPVATETAANQTAAPEIASRASEPVHAASPKKPESFWSYRGLLDRVVAATGERRNSAPEPAAAAEIAAGKTAAVDVAEVLVNPEAAVEVETAREAAPEVVLVEVTESARQISAISSSPAPSSGPVSFVEGSFVEASFAEAEPSMEIATVTMEVPEHPMLDVIEPETAGAQETAIEQETPI
ncbi:MAG: hypothetical protein JNL98_34820, partial [Bryobacterales bacterium]|nr:hypothetical protein [Bryobacterales bacterium]